MKLSTRPAKNQPTIMPRRTPREARNSRVRSSRKWSSRDIEPSAARSNWLTRPRRRGSRLIGYAASVVTYALDRVDDRLRRGLTVQGPAGRLRLRLGVDVILGQALGLGLENP